MRIRIRLSRPRYEDLRRWITVARMSLRVRLVLLIVALVALVAMAYGLFVVIHTLVSGNPVPGYPSLLVVILFIGGVQMVSIGILGEYVGRIFNEAKQRPLYLLNGVLPSTERAPGSVTAMAEIPPVPEAVNVEHGAAALADAND